MNDVQKILEMIESGKLTAKEGYELLEVIKSLSVDTLEHTKNLSEEESASEDKLSSENSQKPESEEQNDNTSKADTKEKKKTFDYLRVVVLADKQNININVGIPLGMFKVMGKMAGDVAKFIPQEARKEMADQGIDINTLDILGMIEAVEKGFVDNPYLINMNIHDEGDDNVVIQLYLD